MIVILSHSVFYKGEYYKTGQKVTIDAANAAEMAKHGKVIEQDEKPLETAEKPVSVKRGRRKRS